MPSANRQLEETRPQLAPIFLGSITCTCSRQSFYSRRHERRYFLYRHPRRRASRRLERDGEEWEGYSGTLAEKGGANISYFPFLNDKELEKLQNWIAQFPEVILGKWDWEGSQSDLVKRFNAWQRKLGKRDKNTLKKLRENGFKLTKQGYALHKISEAKWQDAVGLANNNDVYFFGYCSY